MHRCRRTRLPPPITTAAITSSSLPTAVVGSPDREPRELHHAGEAGEQAGQRVDRRLDARDVDAAQAGGRLVRPSAKV